MNEKTKTMVSFIGRLALSAILLIWLFSKVDLKHMAEALKDADMGMMSLAFCVYVITTIFILWRWRILMKSVGLKVSRFDSIRWFYIGQSCNLFLPTSVGGDVIKGLGVAKITGNKPKVFASIILDRLIGFSAIVVTAIVSFSFGRAIVADNTVMISIALMTLVSAMLAAIFLSHRVFSTFCRIFGTWPKIKDALLRLHDNLLLLRTQKKRAVEALVLSLVAQFILAFAFYLTAKAMHQDINLVYFIIFSPLVCVATALPSIGGLGIREVGWVYLLSKVGVHQGVALGISLMNFAFMVIIGIFGGLLYVITLSHRRVQSS